MTCHRVVVVRLNDVEVEQARHVGQLRLRASINVGRNPARSQVRGMDERLLHEHVGCMAELAVARWAGIPWTGSVNTFHTMGDVGEWDVRSSPRHDRRLIVRDNDHEDRVVVFVTGRGPVMYLRGWIIAGDARRPEYLMDPHNRRPSWFVHPGDLEPMDALRELLEPSRRRV